MKKNKIFSTIILSALAFNMLSWGVHADFQKGLLWDVPKNHSLYKYMDKLVHEGIVSVYPNGAFKSEDPVTRYQASRFIYNALLKDGCYNAVQPKDQSTMPTVNPFPDVPTNNFYAFYVNQLKNSGMISGFSDGTFGGSHYLTRGEMIAILNAGRRKADPSYQIPNYRMNPNSIPTSHRFSDVNVDNVFYNYIYTSLVNGYITNNPLFNTNAHVTKAEMTAMLNNILYAPLQSVCKSNNTDNVDHNDTTKNPTKVPNGVFYEGAMIRYQAKVVPVSDMKFGIIIDNVKTMPQIPYLSKAFLSVKSGDTEYKVSKITLLQVKGNQVIYGIYTTTPFDKDKELKVYYSDSSTQLAGVYDKDAKVDTDTKKDKDTDTNKDKDNKDKGDKKDNTDNKGNGDGDKKDDTNTSTANKGDLVIQLAGDTPKGKLIPADASWVKVATYELKATWGDISVNSITVERTGFSDSDTLTSMALTDMKGNRISKARNDSQDNWTSARLQFLTPLVIKAGETAKVNVIVSVADSSKASGDRFEVQIKSAELNNASNDAKVEIGTKNKSERFDVAAMNAPTIKIEKGLTVSNPKLGDTNAEVFKFDVEGDNSNNVKLKSITFESTNSKMKEDLRNIVLKLDDKKVATGMINDKYVSFVFDEPIDINYSQTKKFTMYADVIAGAGDKIGFFVSDNIDVKGSYNSDYSINADVSNLDSAGNTNEFTIGAGELSLVNMNSEFDEIHEGKSDVEVAKLKINNTSDTGIELQKFGIRVQLMPGNARIHGNAKWSLTLKELFDNVYLVSPSGSKFELKGPSGSETDFVYSDSDLLASIKKGENVFKILVDTNNNIDEFNTANLKLSLTVGDINSTTGWFYAVETANDNEISDITPSIITWGNIKGSESSIKASVIPLSNITKVKGAENVDILKFDLKADSSANVSVKEAKFTIEGNGKAATNQQIASVSLYKNGEVKPENLLDSRSGNQLSSKGEITFGNFTEKVEKNKTKSFVLAVSFVDGPSAVSGSKYQAKLEDLTMQDDNGDSVPYINGTLTSTRQINIADTGSVLLTEDVNNTENKFDKLILAGNSDDIFSIDVQADNEEIDVRDISFVVNKDLTKILKNATLLLNDKVIYTNAYSDNTVDGGSTTIRFSGLNNLRIPQSNNTLKLRLNTNTIWFEKLGEVVKDMKVAKVEITKATGVESRNDMPTVSKNISTSKLTSIVPATLKVEIPDKLNNGIAKLKIKIDTGNNSISTSNSAPQVKLQDLIFTELSGNSDGYSIYKEGESTRKGTISATGQFNKGTMSDDDLTLSGDVTYIIVPTGTSDKTYSLNLVRKGIKYSVINPDGSTITSDIYTQFPTEYSLGSKSY